MNNKVYIQKFFKHPTTKVWDAITKSENIEKWFLKKADFKPEVGYKYKLEDEPFDNWDGFLYGEVKEVDEYKKIVYTFDSNNLTFPMEVTWTLTAQDNGTLLTVIHSDFDKISDPQKHFISIDIGWTRCVFELTKFINMN